MTPYLAGLDIGQSQDPTALVILERRANTDPVVYDLRFLQRFALRISYPDSFEGVRLVMNAAPLPNQTTRLVDATGGGYGHVERIPVTVVKLGGKRVQVDAPLKKGGMKRVWGSPENLLRLVVG